jgi:hypothetical protein
MVSSDKAGEPELDYLSRYKQIMASFICWKNHAAGFAGDYELRGGVSLYVTTTP